jgi:hypothetical protein
LKDVKAIINTIKIKIFLPSEVDGFEILMVGFLVV